MIIAITVVTRLVRQLILELFSAAIRVLNWMIKRSRSMLAVIMYRYVVFKGVILILDLRKWRISKGVIPVSETYPFTDKATIV